MIKRNIDQKLHLLKHLYDTKQSKSKVKNLEKLNLISPTFLNCPTNVISPT